MKNLRLCLMTVITMLFAASVSARAEETSPLSLSVEFTKHWASKLPDNTRLCDLSIACSHDAATWDSYTDFAKDQVYCERDLFNFGVRAFDLRLGPDGNYRHGEDANGLLSDDCKTFKDEQDNYMPTKEQLKGEFMILFISFEGKDSMDKRKEMLNEWIHAVMDSEKNAYNMEMFVTFNNNLKLSDLRGKILVLGEEDDGFCSANITDKSYRIPIASWGKEGFYGLFDTSDATADIAAEDKKAASKNQKQKWFSHGDWSLGRADKLDDITTIVANWCTEYEKDRSEGGLGNTLNKWGINSYKTSPWYDMEVGYETACDDDDKMGSNHWTYITLQDCHIPYGFVQFDFVAVKEYEGHLAYGDKLLERVIMNNFTWRADNGKYISDVALCLGTEQETVQNAATEYFNNSTYTLTGALGNTYTTTFAYKTTDNAEEAIADMFIYRNTSVGSSTNADPVLRTESEPAPETITLDDGRVYKKATVLNTYTTNGNTLLAHGGEFLYLYYTKECNSKATGSGLIEKLTDSKTTDASSKYIKEYIHNGDKYVVSKTTKNFCDGMNALSSSDDVYSYLKITSHEHDFVNSYSDKEHYKLCQTCGLTTDIKEHDMHLHAEESYHHTYRCSDPDCKYVISHDCADDKYDDNGFGTCTVCGKPCAQPAEKTGTDYYISKVGQLYWFADKVNNANAHYNVVLDNDIVVPEDIQETHPWIPIGTYRDEEGNVIQAFSQGYSGTFDGAGHTISGIRYAGGSAYPAHGLFGSVINGTIVNLGIVNSSFSGNGIIGSIAGRLHGAHVENVFCTAVVKKEAAGPEYGGLFGEFINTEVSNAVYSGSVYLFGDLKHKAVGQHFTGNVLKNIYTSDEKESNNDVTILTPEEFTNGDLLQRLNDNVDAHNFALNNGKPWIYWQQEIGTDNAPHFDSATLDYLCFTAGEDETTISFKRGLTSLPDLKYSFDGKFWFDYDKQNPTITLKNKGDKVYFRAKGKNKSFSYYSNTIMFDFDKKVAASGNIMTLLNGFRNETTVPDNAFNCLFKDCTTLTSAPELPATTLGEQCYQAMFENCTSLTEAPVLPATELKNLCYVHMFYGCSNLSKITVGFTDWENYHNTKGWVEGVAETGTFVRLNDLAIIEGTGAIPFGWLKLPDDEKPTGIEATFDRTGNRDGKYMMNGRIFILKNGIKYDISGRKL